MANNQGPGKRGQKQEQTTSDSLHHMTSKKVLVLHNPDGSQQHIPAEEHQAMPSGDGKYDNVHYVNYLQDSNNIALPAEKAVNTPQSYTGLFIDDPQKHGLCRCRLHRLLSGNSRRDFLDGEDGNIWPGQGQNGYCSTCGSAMGYVKWVLAVVGLAALAGLYRGIGCF